MSKTVSQLKTSVSGLLQGTNLDNVTNLNGALERAARTVILRAGVPEATSKASITLYDSVFDYTQPSDIFGGAVLDLRTQGISRAPDSYVYREPIQVFDMNKGLLSNGYALTFERRNGTSIMRVANTKATSAIVLDPMTATTGWTASGSASTPVVDTTNFYQEPSSLRYTLTGASSGSITKTITATNLTSYQGVGVAFLAVYIPSVANLTSLTLKIGSSSANYYSVTATQGFLGTWIANNWLLVAFDLSTATTVGTPVITAMTYIEVAAIHSGTLTNFRVGGLTLALPSPHELIYQTAAIFTPTGSSTPLRTISDDNDTVNFNDEIYVIYEYECAVTVALQSGGSISSGVVANYNSILNGARTRTGAVIQLGLYDLYRANNPDEKVRTTGSWYDN